MPTTNLLKKGLNLKRWEPVATALTATGSGACVKICNHVKQLALYLAGASSAYLYNPEEDGWVTLSSPSLGALGGGAGIAAGSFSTGSTVAASSLTATGGTVSTIITNQTLANDLRGFSIHIMAGPNAGLTLPILSNTIGANATITVATQASAFTASTVYRLVTPVWYVIGGGTLASGVFKKYDYATNTWTTLVHSGLAASLGTDGDLTCTPSWSGTDYVSFATGTATAGGAATLTNSGKSWTTNQWTNYQIRITAGTGAGQIRTISSNTGTVITVSSNWTTQPDNTSQYSIEGNDDFIYYMGNSAITLYRYSISGNTWTTLSPTAARTGSPTSGMCSIWANESNESDWKNENNIINGRRIYSFRGGNGGIVDYYDIALNTWVSSLSYTPNAEVFTTGTKYTYYKNCIYIHKDATGRWFCFDIVTQQLYGITPNNLTSGSAVIGNTAYVYRYRDGETVIPYIYYILNMSTVHERMMII